MIFFIGDDHVVAPYNRRDRTEVGLVASAKYQHLFFAHKRRKTILKLVVQLERAIHEARPSAACAKTVDSLLRRLSHFWMGGQSQIVIGPDHDDVTPLILHNCAFGVLE